MKGKTKGELRLVSNCWQGGNYCQITVLIATVTPKAQRFLTTQSL